MTFNGVSVSFLRARLKGGAAGNLVDLTVVEIAGIHSRVVNTLMTSLAFTYIYIYFFLFYVAASCNEIFISRYVRLYIYFNVKED